MHHRLFPPAPSAAPGIPPWHALVPDVAGTALRALHRAGGVALTPAQLRERTRMEGGEGYGSAEELTERLEAREDLFRILSPRRRHGGGTVPRAWIVARRPPPDTPGTPPLLARMRQGLRFLATRVDPDSTREMARWERYLLEEARVARVLERRERRRLRREGREAEPP